MVITSHILSHSLKPIPQFYCDYKHIPDWVNNYRIIPETPRLKLFHRQVRCFLSPFLVQDEEPK
jgi:hypothetical protein